MGIFFIFLFSTTAIFPIKQVKLVNKKHTKLCMPSVMSLLLVHYPWHASDPVGCPGPDVAPAQPCPLNCSRRRELELKH